MRGLPEDAIVTCDAGENRIMMTHFYQTKSAEGFLQAAGAGPMGFGIPAALGAKLVHPDRPVVAVVGDGGFAMTMNGLMTAVEQDIPIITVVFNNKALGWVLHGSGPFAAEFNDWDHAAIARALGCRGVRVTDPAGFGAGVARCARRARADGDRRDDLAQGHLRRHHLAIGQRRVAAPEVTKKGERYEQPTTNSPRNSQDGRRANRYRLGRRILQDVRPRKAAPRNRVPRSTRCCAARSTPRRCRGSSRWRPTTGASSTRARSVPVTSRTARR